LSQQRETCGCSAPNILVLMVNGRPGRLLFCLFNDPRHGRKSLLRTREKLVNPRRLHQYSSEDRQSCFDFQSEWLLGMQRMSSRSSHFKVSARRSLDYRIASPKRLAGPKTPIEKSPGARTIAHHCFYLCSRAQDAFAMRMSSLVGTLRRSVMT
jgi:hypothetical protein